MKKLKKKYVTLMLLLLLSVGSMIPIVSSAAVSWDYGYNSKTMKDFSIYYNTYNHHAAGITKKGVLWKTSYVGPYSTAAISLDFNGPYLVSYHKFDY